MKKKFFGREWYFEKLLEEEPKDLLWAFRIDKKIYSGKSKYQKIEIYQNLEMGKILLLDGSVELTTAGEFVYHELLVHPAFVYSRKTPQKVLILGGGDGGVLREVLKWPVKEVVLIEIDKKVIEISQKYLPEVSKGAFKDPRVKVIIGDALETVPSLKEKFDVVIFDISDSKGPAKDIWNRQFFKELKKKLNNEGVLAAQTGFFREKYAVEARKTLRELFGNFTLHKAYVESYPFEEHTFSFVSDKVNFEKISLDRVEKLLQKHKIKTCFYSPLIHFSTQQIPQYLKKFIFKYRITPTPFG